jgi:AcrR family transcriptional regulator
MARRPSITDEQILEAARACFEEYGLSATTAQIAQRAGVSEGSLFRRFPTKLSLFHAAMAMRDPEWFALLDELQGTGDLRDNLNTIALQMLDHFESVIRRFSMVMAMGPSEEHRWEGNEIPIRVIGRMSRFFESERRAGRIRGADPEVLARMLLGSLHHYAFAELHGLNDFYPMPRKTYIRGVVDTLMRGIEPFEGGDA